MEATNFVSVKELRDNLKEALRKSGALNSVKAHIRKEFISGLSHTSTARKSIDNSLKMQLLLSVIYHHLQKAGFSHTLSVFVAESGLDATKTVSERDILSSLKIGASATVERTSKSGVNGDGDRVCNSSVLENIVDVVSTAFRNTVECSVQTESAGPGVRELLDNQIRDLQTSYLSRRETERLLPTKTIEERMIAYQRECESRMRQDLEAQINHLRSVEIAHVRLEESKKMRMELEYARRELENSYQSRIQSHAEREVELSRVAAEKERRTQQMEFEARQHMQRELEELRCREESSRRKADLEMQSTRMLEARLKEMQVVLESRERELSRREKELEMRNAEMEATARDGARATVEGELESLLREKASLMIERKRFEDEKSDDRAMRSAVSEMRQRHREMEEAILQKDDEIGVLKQTLVRMKTAMSAEQNATAQLLDHCGLSNHDETGGMLGLNSSTKVDGILALIRKNVELESSVSQLRSDLIGAGEGVIEQQQQLAAVMADLKHCEKELESKGRALQESHSTIDNMNSDIVKLKRAIVSMKRLSTSADTERKELEQLVSEQRGVISKLRKDISALKMTNVSESTSSSGSVDGRVAAMLMASGLMPPGGYTWPPLSQGQYPHAPQQSGLTPQTAPMSSARTAPTDTILTTTHPEHPHATAYHAVASSASSHTAPADITETVVQYSKTGLRIQGASHGEDSELPQRTVEPSTNSVSRQSADEMSKKDHHLEVKASSHDREERDQHDGSHVTLDRQQLEREERDRIEMESRARLDRENRERAERDRRERDRVEREERDRLEWERVERDTRDRLDREQRENERMQREKEDRERAERDRLDRVQREQDEKNRIEREERERLQKEQMEKDEKNRRDRERLERESQEEQDRIEKEERERADQEANERLERERQEEAERDRIEKEKSDRLEQDRRDREEEQRREKEEHDREREEQNRIEREQGEQAERERLEKESELAAAAAEKKRREEEDAKARQAAIARVMARRQMKKQRQGQEASDPVEPEPAIETAEALEPIETMDDSLEVPDIGSGSSSDFEW